MIHFVPNMYVSGKISALRPCTQTVKKFWNSKKIRKLPKQRDFRICGFLRFFAGFCGNFAGFLRGFAGFLPDRLRRCKYFLSFVSPSSKTCNQSLKIEDLGVLGKISWYRSNSENTYFPRIWRVQDVVTFMSGILQSFGVIQRQHSTQAEPEVLQVR